MNSTYEWIKRLPAALMHKDDVPLVPKIQPPFPWEAAAAQLKEFFSLQDLALQPASGFQLHAAENLLNGFGTAPRILYISLLPSAPPVCWVMSEQDINWIMSILLHITQDTINTLEPSLKDEFFKFVSIQALDVFSHNNSDEALKPQIEEHGALPTDHALSMDVNIRLNGKIFLGRLILNDEFRQAWKEQHADRTLEIADPLLEHLNVTMHIEAGYATLKLPEWEQVREGDFILLDFCSLKSEEEGRVMLTVNGAPLFRGKIKDGNVKILEHPLYHEGEES